MVTVNKNTIELVSSPLSPHPAMIDLPQPLPLSSDNKLPWPSATPSRVALQPWNVMEVTDLVRRGISSITIVEVLESTK